MPHLLAADIGGTHSRFALFQTGEGGTGDLHLVAERKLRSRDFTGIGQAIASLYEADGGAAPLLIPKAPPRATVLAVAGVVAGDYCRLPNAPWNVSAQDASVAAGGGRVFLLNDFAAQAYACLIPELMDMEMVLPGTGGGSAGRGEQELSLAVVGAGTGFGTAHILCPGANGASESGASPATLRLAKARILPGEGGHVEFPFIGKEEFAFAEFAAKRAGTDRLIGDYIVGGWGFAALVSFATGAEVTPEQATAEYAAHEASLALYARFYGRACRNFALPTLGKDGLYVGGGMALRVPVLTHPAFAAEFLAGSQADFTAKIPVYHMRKPQAGLWGAALFGLLRTQK